MGFSNVGAAAAASLALRETIREQQKVRSSAGLGHSPAIPPRAPPCPAITPSSGLGSLSQQFPSLPSPPAGSTSSGSCSALSGSAELLNCTEAHLGRCQAVKSLEKSAGQRHFRGNKNTSVDAGRGGWWGFRPRREGTAGFARAAPRTGPNPPFPKDDCEG